LKTFYKEDELYLDPYFQMENFLFNETVASVFPDMIKRSVPGYSTILEMIGLMTKRYSIPETHLYDLGCSLGAVSLILKENSHSCKVVGVDNSKSMISLAKKRMKYKSKKVSFLLSDIENFSFSPSSIIVLNFTLQFIPINQREALLRRIKNALLPGGILILSEKIIGETKKENLLQLDMHHAFKRIQNYSEMEIKKKQSSLDNVLFPETVSQHLNRLLRLGFSVDGPWFQNCNFISIVAKV